GAEALLRWQHPQRGIVTPGEFIPLAEETGLIVPIGEWVLKAACARARQWKEEGFELRVSVNLSARQFAEKTLVEDVARALHASGLAPEALELEITETVVMQNPAEAAIYLAHALKMRAVAEGVETEEQAQWLSKFGCEELQGELLAKPMPGEELATLFLKPNRRIHAIRS